jgi:NADH-quinone oxidoreductase subunit E
MELTATMKEKVEKIRRHFPTNQALLIPLLHAIQEEEGWISTEAMEAAGDYLGLPLARVEEVVSFYTMFHRAPIGKQNLQVCTNISCMLNGSGEILDCLKKRIGIGPGETTEDGRYTIEEVECLASCGTAPVVQVNKDYHEGLDTEKLNQLMDRLDEECERSKA